MHNPKLKQAIISIVENQLNQNNPPEVRLTLDRLMSEDPDCDYDEAVRKITVVLTEEMYEMMKNQRNFDLTRYIKKLNEL